LRVKIQKVTQSRQNFIMKNFFNPKLSSEDLNIGDHYVDLGTDKRYYQDAYLLGSVGFVI